MTIRYIYSLIFSALSILTVLINQTFAQQLAIDTTVRELPSATVSAYLSTQPYLHITSSIGLIDTGLLKLQQGNTLLPSLNTIPGVRMEERSPGSYRLSIRGSLLRSPFGIRNVKTYFDEIPLTDAGGNTYLNLLDPSALQSLTVLKGPDGSLFGANSGGVVLINPNISSQTGLNITSSGGSYGLYHQQLSGNFVVNPKYHFSMNYAFQRADGYRENTSSKRHYFQTVQRYRYTNNSELRLVGFYSNMDYRTPGGLTESQFLENPRQARPAAGPIPGAVEQRAGIYNKTLQGGLIHEAALSNSFKHVVSIFGSYTDFTNPFITNYENRYENNMGFRSYLSYEKNQNQHFMWTAHAGIEWQKGNADILNYDNNQGTKGNEQAGDALKNDQHFYFVRFRGEVNRRLNIETALSLNYYHYAYKNLFPETSDYQKVSFSPAWMPRFALSYTINSNSSWRLSSGRGFSPGSAAEVRSSDNIINTALRPETGWNHETGFRWQSNGNRFQADASVFLYRMQDAIVRLVNDDGAEFFTNAGGVRQRGLEAALSAWIIQPRKHTLINGLRISSNITWSHFRFSNYIDNNNDYSGNKLTGVPGEVVVSSIHTLFPKKISFYLQHNYTARIPLNDANTAFADSYQLLQGKLMWDCKVSKKILLSIFTGADNLLNQRYSLGNDINAFGNRFFNTAMPRNYYLGLNLRI
ncbi:TonB-dependent receptor [Olivibacter sp. SDN3]|uniref:TonB-dependent receptor n=1 Tax=Olivibacter sp. SDN3 TaxID=2764720 RepID=UPI001651350A|nr:TonB-dependent receptor [Olivibacter sp. SDN3]QNL49973.1 TonB-dependent receptor [Olivibacter sp. SDN3]